MENKQHLRQEKQKKIMKVLLTLIATFTFVIITMKQFSDETLGVKNIQNMMGEEYSGGEPLTVRENIILRTIIDAYVESIHSGDFTKAYSVVFPKYKEFITKETFTTAMQKIGIENFIIEGIEIEQLAERLFLYHVTLKDNNKLELLLMLDEKKYYIVPEPFLEYNEINKSIKRSGVKYTLKNYQVDVERCIFDLTIENTQNKPIEIIEVMMKNQNGATYTALNSKTTIEPNQTKEVSFLIETHLDFPSALQLVRKDGEKVRLYTFEL